MKIQEQYDSNTANVLVPTQTVTQVSPWHAARTSVVRVNPNPDSGDIFKVGSKYNPETKAYEDLFSLAKPALMRIAAAAGIVWNWRDSGPQALQRDYVVYKAVGAVRLPDGSWQPIVGTKEIDLTVVEEEQRVQFELKADQLIRQGGLSADEARRYKCRWEQKGDKKICYLDESERQRYIDEHVRSVMVQWRKNKLMRAETGAMLRVIRAALGLKSQYTKTELEKPFVVPRIDFAPDYSDPEVRRALIEHGVGSMAALFGQALPSNTPAALPSGHQAFERPALEAIPAADGEDEQDDLPWADSGDEEAQAEPSVSATPEPEVEADPGADGLPFPGAPPAPTCEVCGKEVSAKVADYSSKHFGQVLCYGCQKKQGGGAA